MKSRLRLFRNSRPLERSGPLSTLSATGRSGVLKAMLMSRLQLKRPRLSSTMAHHSSQFAGKRGTGTLNKVTTNKKQEAHLLSLMVEALCDKADALIAEAERKEGMAYDAENSIPGCDDYDYAQSYRHESFLLKSDAHLLFQKARELETKLKEVQN